VERRRLKALDELPGISKYLTILGLFKCIGEILKLNQSRGCNSLAPNLCHVGCLTKFVYECFHGKSRHDDRCDRARWQSLRVGSHDPSGFVSLFARNVQEVSPLSNKNLAVSHTGYSSRIGICRQVGTAVEYSNEYGLTCTTRHAYGHSEQVKSWNRMRVL
jgi:hypothetical protein